MMLKRILDNFFQHEQNMPKSIWGRPWTRDRKWFYPAWLICETSVRFYGYAHYVYNYFEEHHEWIVPYVGEIGAQTLDVLFFCVVLLGSLAFLTVPACFALYIFFKKESLTGTKFEKKIKRLL